MSDAIRNIVMRVQLQPGEQAALPDWTKATGAAAQYFDKITTGTKEAATQINETRANVEKLAGWLDSAGNELEQLAGSVDSLEDVKTAVSAYGAEIQAAFDLNTEQTEQVIKQLTAVAEQMYNESSARIVAEEKAAADKRIGEQRRVAEEAAKAANDFRQNWVGGLASLAGAAGAAGQLLGVVKLLGAQNDDIEQLARHFVAFQATFQAFQAGASGLNALNEALGKLQIAASAAQTQLAATGASATLTQGALLRMAPAAAAAQAALGPIGLALAAISVAAVAVQAGFAFFGEDLPDDTELATQRLEEYNQALQETQRELDGVGKLLAGNMNLIRQEAELQKALNGGDINAQDIQLNLQNETRGANRSAQVEFDKAVAAAAGQLLQGRSKELNTRLKGEQVTRFDVQQLEKESRDKARLFGADDPRVAAIDEMLKEASRELETRLKLLDLKGTNVAESGRIAIKSEGLPVDLRSQILDPVNGLIEDENRAILAARQALQQEQADINQKINEGATRIKEQQAQFDRERTIALQLQQEPGQLKKVEQQLRGQNLFQGIQTLRPLVDTEEVRRLEGLLADQKLTVNDLLKSLQDAASIDEEAAALEQFIQNETNIKERLLETLEKSTTANDRLLRRIELQEHRIDDLNAALRN